MLSYEDAVARILTGIVRLKPRDIPLIECLGLVLNEDVVCPYPLPPFTNSAMDGFAVRAEDLAAARSDSPVRLQIVGELTAGDAPLDSLRSGQAISIMTGAPLPPGADSVVPIEDAEADEAAVSVSGPIRAGQSVRKAGEDLAAGSTVLHSGIAITPAAIGLAAACGRASLRVIPRPRVAVIGTGDELVEPGRPLAAGQIYNTNVYAIGALAQAAGAVVVSRQRALDQPESVADALKQAADCDVIVTIGGVSVGRRDFVKQVVEQEGEIDFWQVAIRPGKPFVHGRWRESLFFGLPGNPVSSMVTFELFVRPALRKLAGDEHLGRTLVQAQLEETVEHEPGRTEFLRAVVRQSEGTWRARPLTRQGSGMLSAMLDSNALVIIPKSATTVAAGTLVTAMLIGGAQ